MALQDYGAFIRSGMSLVPSFSDQLVQQVGLAAKKAEIAQANAQTQEIATKLNRAQMFQKDLTGVQADPSPQNVSALIMKYPEYGEQIKGGWDVKDKAAKDADLTQLGGIYSAAASGNWDLARQQAQARVDAEKAAGTADAGDEQFVKSLEAAAGGDTGARKNVLAALGTHIAAVAGPDHFASVYGALKGGYTLDAGATRYDDNGNVVAQSPFIKGADGTLFERDGTAPGTAPTDATTAPHPDSHPINASPQAASVASALSGAGLPPPVVAGFMGNFHVEGGFDGAKGDGGSASGIAQWHNDRAANFEKVIGKSVTDATPAEQAQFVNWEMQHPEAAGMTVTQRDAILNAKTAPQAASLIDQYYERSSGKDRQDRMTAASAFAGGSNGSASAAPAGYHVLVPAKPQDAPSGYRYTGDGSLEAIPGGPADPNGVKNAGPLKPQALEAATIAYAKTGKMPAGMGGQTTRNQILNYLPTVMDRYGLTPDDIPSIQQQFQADSKAYSQRVGQLSYMHQSVGKLNQHAQDLSALIKAVPAQGSFKPFNWITQGVEGAFSNSTVTQLAAGLPLFEAEVARVMTGNPNSGAGQLSDNARHEFAVLSSMVAPKAKVDAVNRIMKMTEEAVKATRDETLNLKRRIGGGIDVYAGNAPAAEAAPKPEADEWITLPSGLKIRKIK